MSISPPSDIVFDVAKAADPEKLRAAASRLAKMVGGGESEFEGAMKAEEARTKPMAGPTPDGSLRQDIGQAGRPADSGRKDSPYRSFEAMALSTFIESAMPLKADSFFGSGTAGQVWKSLLARQLGDQMARAGGIGIARLIEKTHPAGLEEKPPIPWLDPQSGALVPSLRLNSNAKG